MSSSATFNWPSRARLRNRRWPKTRLQSLRLQPWRSRRSAARGIHRVLEAGSGGANPQHSLARRRGIHKPISSNSLRRRTISDANGLRLYQETWWHRRINRAHQADNLGRFAGAGAHPFARLRAPRHEAEQHPHRRARARIRPRPMSLCVGASWTPRCAHDGVQDNWVLADFCLWEGIDVPGR